MSALMMLLLAQVVTGRPVPAQVERLSFSDGHRSFPLYASPVLVAERSPSDAVKAQVLAADPGAVVTLQTATMRVWKVRDAARVRDLVPALKPVLFDVPSLEGRFRVPLSLVCGDGERQVPWAEVLAGSGRGGCLPNFWYPSHPK